MSDTPLFDRAADRSSALTPLAERMRPRRLDEVIGQEHLVGSGQFLTQALLARKLPSLILWGPPGCGKTTIARLLADADGAVFATLSAVLSGVKELRAELETADRRRSLERRQTLLFIDEIHRYSKSQQDALLHHVERGSVILVGATTENPSFELNSALLSRCKVLVLRPLDCAALVALLERALTDRDRGLGRELPPNVELLREALGAIARFSQGDARRALSTLEVADALLHSSGGAFDVALVELATQHKALRHDASGDQHFQVVSALIKSLRGSDPDAGLYWLARMIEGGEDVEFICRRLVIFASEDIGNADPGALAVAMHASEAARFVGWPEAQLALAQAVTYLALAPKSNRSTEALGAAMAKVREHGPLPVPLHLVNAETPLMKELGFGKGYDYPHDHRDAMGRQQYLPDAIAGSEFYQPSERGREAELKKRLDAIRAFRKDT